MRRLLIVRFLNSSFFRSKLGNIFSISKFHFLIQILNSKTAILGISILMILIAMTIYAVIAIPLESFKQWNNPNYWINYPKACRSIMDQLRSIWSKRLGANNSRHSRRWSSFGIRKRYSYHFSYLFCKFQIRFLSYGLYDTIFGKIRTSTTCHRGESIAT